jgi:hypothetical protein
MSSPEGRSSLVVSVRIEFASTALVPLIMERTIARIPAAVIVASGHLHPWLA